MGLAQEISYCFPSLLQKRTAVHQISSCRSAGIYTLNRYPKDRIQYLLQPQNIVSPGRQHKHQLRQRRLQLIAVHTLCSYSNQSSICISSKQERSILTFNSTSVHQEKDINKKVIFSFFLSFNGLITSFLLVLLRGFEQLYNRQDHCIPFQTRQMVGSKVKMTLGPTSNVKEIFHHEYRFFLYALYLE